MSRPFPLDMARLGGVGRIRVTWSNRDLRRGESAVI